MTMNEDIEKSYKLYLSQQYEIAGFPLNGTVINKQVFLDRYDEIPQTMLEAIDALKKKQNIFVALDSNDIQWKYDIVCYLLNTFFVNSANVYDEDEYSVQTFAKWVDSPIWFPKFDRDPDYDTMKAIRFVYMNSLIDFALHYKNHVYLMSNLLTFRKNSNVVTVIDAGDGDMNIFKTAFDHPVFSEQTKKMLLSNSIFIKMTSE